MAFPVLGQPLPQFVDSNGDPLNGGTLEIRDPISNANKSTYPTAADADAATNANSADISLNIRGEPEQQIWGVYDEEYKVTLKDSSGTSIWTATDIGRDVGTVPSTQLVYARTNAELQASVTPTNYYYKPGNVLRYGADPTYTTDSLSALQSAINAVSYAHDTGDHPTTVYIPAGHYKLSGNLYCEYDATNNTSFNGGANSTYHGRMTIEGDGYCHPNDPPNNRARSTVLHFGNGYSFIVSTGSNGAAANIQTRAFRCRDLVIWGDYAGYMLTALYITNGSELSNIVTHNESTNTAAGGFDISDSWESEYKHLYAYGPDVNGKSDEAGGSRTTATGTGFRYRTEAAFGGNTMWQNCNANGWDEAFRLGYEAATLLAAWPGSSGAAGIRNHMFVHCQPQYCRIGFNIMAGIASAKFVQCWGEWIDEFNGQPGANFWIHESAGKLKFGAGTNEVGGIIIDMGSIGQVNTASPGTHDVATVRVGSDDADVDASAAGTVILDNVLWDQVSSPTVAIRRYNSKENGPLIIRNPQVTNNGSYFLVLDDEPQYAPVYIEGVDGLRWLSNERWVVDESGNDMRHWLSGRGDVAAYLSSATATFDYRESQQLASQIDTNVGNAATHTVKLPSWSRMSTDYAVLHKLQAGGGTITLDASAPAWQATTYYADRQIVSKGGELYCVTQAGTSGATGPTGTSDGQTDGTVIWNHLATGDHTINGASSTVSFDAANVALLIKPTSINSNSSVGIDWSVKVLSTPIPYIGSPSATNLRDALITAGLMASS